MLRRQDIILVVLVFSLFLIACKDSGTKPPEGSFPPSVEGNLLPNGSFEFDHTPTLQGWRVGNAQSASLVNGAPPNGGNWSLELTADGAPTMGFAYAAVKGAQSGDILRLSTFVRSVGPTPGGGVILLKVGPNVWNGTRKSTSSDDTLWTQLTVTDTIALGPTDSLWVVLSSFHSGFMASKGMFDLVKLERLSQR